MVTSSNLRILISHHHPKALAAMTAVDSGFPFVRKLSADDMIGMGEMSKCAHISKVGIALHMYTHHKWCKTSLSYISLLLTCLLHYLSSFWYVGIYCQSLTCAGVYGQLQGMALCFWGRTIMLYIWKGIFG